MFVSSRTQPDMLMLRYSPPERLTSSKRDPDRFTLRNDEPARSAMCASNRRVSPSIFMASIPCARSPAFPAHPQLDMRQVAPAEREIAVALRPQILKPAHRLGQVGNVSGGDSPHHEMRRRKFLEPVALTIVDLLVDGRPDKALKRFDAFPHREIDRHRRIALRSDGGRIVAVVLEPPYEPLAALGEGIDPIEI